ncbi:MAG: hydantoinase/oxoprolinase family protein [Deltaproteobacteria bacterium]|nr:hydantoinase/oxoprolinase family protein [Deltaproteobacteria bacterium]
MARLRIGVDVGGTFTDVCVFDENTGQIFVEKVASTAEDSSIGICQGLRAVLERMGAGGGDVTYLAHGTTVATNTLIQHNGARTGLLITKGFRDLLEIARQTRSHLYDLQIDKPPPLVPRDLRLEVEERVYGNGAVLIPLNRKTVERALFTLKEAGVAAVAVCLLHSYLFFDHEKQIKQMANKMFPEAYLSISHEVTPEFREYERLSTTVVNAYLGPVINHYMIGLENRVKELGIETDIYITQSNGGIISLDKARFNPVRTVLSGPSTGVIGAAHTASTAGHTDIITFDMGGTSTDVCLVQNNQPHVAIQRDIEGYTVKTPMIDVHTVGAGGGSIAWVDTGGHLKVGPHSAGSDPGPVCYARGGVNVTVTDANVVLQTLNPRYLLGGRMPIYADAARQAMAELSKQLGMDMIEVARGIISVVVANMVRAVRVISVQRGYDPRTFTLVGFGGAGPLHAGWIARELNIRRILIPERPGIECAFGILTTDMRSDFTQTRVILPTPANLSEINNILSELETRAHMWLSAENLPEEKWQIRRFVDMRYIGQNFELSVPLPEARLNEAHLRALINSFYDAHERTYGYKTEGEPTQLVTFRVEAYGRTPRARLTQYSYDGEDPRKAQIDERQVYFGQDIGGTAVCPVYERDRLESGNFISGPAIVEQMDSTTVILPGQSAKMDEYRNLVIFSGSD